MSKYMKLINGRWYTDYHYYDRLENGKKGRRRLLRVSLHAGENEYKNALIELGKVLATLDEGIHPRALKSKIHQLKFDPTNPDAKSIWEANILPWFYNYKVEEIDKRIIELYIRDTWNQSAGGKMVAVKSTFKKHMRVLKYAIWTVLPKWELPKVEFVEPPKNRKHPLTIQDMMKTAPFVKAQSKRFGDQYLLAYWVMAYTGLDVSDALRLAPCHFTKDRSWIKSKRGKSGQVIELPVAPPLVRVLANVPWPIISEQPLLQGINSKQVATAIRRAFATAGKPGYSAKDLRRMVGSLFVDAGYSRDWVAKALTHAPGSSVTDRYMGVYDSTLEEAFNRVFGG